GNGSERRTGEGLVQGAVGKAVAQGKVVRGSQVVIHADVEMVVAIALRGGGNEVLIGGGAIRLRIERGDRQTNRIEVASRNHVAGESRLREWIDGRDGTVREIAAAF